MTTWNDCSLVWDNGLSIEESLHNNDLRRYLARTGADQRAWYDHRSKVFFGTNQTYMNARDEHSFLTHPKGFLGSPIWGEPYVRKAFAGYLGESFMTSPEYIIQQHSSVEKYQGKSILIVGAGPSALEYPWQEVRADYLWSCNHFFLNEDLNRRQIDLFAVGNEVDTTPQNTKLYEYLASFPDSIACFETTSRKGKLLAEFKNAFPKQSMYAHTRYRSKIGAIPRLICLAIFLGAKEVLVVGMDGLPQNKPHAFEPGKTPKGSPLFNGAADRFRRQYVVLWDYILNILKPEVEFYNLGEGVESNLSADISRQEFPLSRLENS